MNKTDNLNTIFDKTEISSNILKMVLGKICDKFSSNYADQIERRYNLKVRFVKELQKSKDIFSDPSGGTKYSNESIEAIGGILKAYFDITRTHGSIVLTNMNKTENLYDSIEPSRLAIIIYDEGIKKINPSKYNISLEENERSIKSGLEIVLGMMLQEISPEIISALEQMVRHEKETRQTDDRIDYLISVTSDIRKLLSSNDTNPYPPFKGYDKDNVRSICNIEINDFYNRVSTLVNRRNYNTHTFLKLFGPDSLSEAYIEPKYEVKPATRDLLKNWIRYKWDDSNGGNIHLIKGNPGQGKSMFCLMSIYNFYKVKSGEDIDENDDIPYDNVLLLSLCDSWYTGVLNNRIEEINRSSKEDEIRSVIREIPEMCVRKQLGKTMVFIDGYDDMVANIPDISPNLIDLIIQELGEALINYNHIHCFITIRKTVKTSFDSNDDVVTIDYMDGEDREKWYNEKLNRIEDDGARQDLSNYWNNYFRNLEINMDNRNIREIIGVPLLFRLIIEYKISDLSTVGKVYNDLCNVIFYEVKEELDKHEELAFEIYKKGLYQERGRNVLPEREQLGLSQNIVSQFMKTSRKVQNFVFANAKNDIGFYQDSFRDYFLAKYILRILKRIEELSRKYGSDSKPEIQQKLCEEIQGQLSLIAYRKLGEAYRNSIYILRDLLQLENVTINWKIVLDMVLERLSVINNPEITIDKVVPSDLTVSGNQSPSVIKIEDPDHTDDLRHNYSLREYNYLFCNIISIMSCISYNANDIKIDYENRKRLSYLIKMFDCEEMIICPCQLFNGLEAPRALLSYSMIENGIIDSWVLEGTDFFKTELRDIQVISNTNLKKCGFVKTKFSRVGFADNTDLSWNLFMFCKYENVVFGKYLSGHSSIIEQDFAKINESDDKYKMNDITFRNCGFDNVIFHDCCLDNIVFYGDYSEENENSPAFIDVAFRNCHVNYITYKGCVFVNTDFINCDFRHTVFDGCTFAGVVFDNVNGLFASSFINDCHIQNNSRIIDGEKTDFGLKVNNTNSYNFNIFDKLVYEPSRRSCIIALSVKNIIKNDVMEYVKDDKTENMYTLFDGEFGNTVSIEEINNIIDEEMDLSEKDRFYIEVVQEGYRMIHISWGRKEIEDFGKASERLCELLKKLHDALNKNDISDVHFFYGGPVFIPFYVGKILGNAFNIHIYQYSMNEHTYYKVSVSAESVSI